MQGRLSRESRGWKGGHWESTCEEWLPQHVLDKL